MKSRKDNPEHLTALFVSTSYPVDSKDWRGRFVANLIEAMSRCEDVALRVWAPPGEIPPSVKSASTRSENIWLKHMLYTGGMAHIIRTKGIRAAIVVLCLMKRLRHVYVRESMADIFHINWLQNSFPLWGVRKPVVISVLGSDYGLLNLTGMKFLLRSVLRQRTIIIAPNAEWMVSGLEKSFGDIAEIRVIPFGVDSKWFALENHITNSDRFHWISVSRVTAKKIGNLFKWGKGLFNHKNILHLFGPMQEPLSIPEWVHYHGPVSPDELLNKWFPLCTGLLTLSQHNEGRPQVILEAMASGLPVVASDLPAHLDIIKHKENGWIVSNVQDLKDAISFFSSPDVARHAGIRSRNWVLKNIGTWDDCAMRYISAYRDVLEQSE